MESIETRIKKIDKPFVKSIQSPDGDIIDCVLIQLQPAFDLPELKGTMQVDPPEIPKGNETTAIQSEMTQLWNSNGESCPDGTIPIRRTNESDIFESKFGKKVGTQIKKADVNAHEHVVAYVTGEEYHGAKASLNVWAPMVTNPHEFSLSQIWILSDTTILPYLNTLEAGWQVAPDMYKDNRPRFFIYWTNNGYRSGCYNLHCSGFIQTTHKYCLGCAIVPVSRYNGAQFDITLMIWKDPRSGNWWLRLGDVSVGYWPASLLPRLKDHGSVLEFGGEVININAARGPHTSTQMGSGHFSAERFGKASYIRNMEKVDKQNTLRPVSDLNLLVEKPNCYDATKGFNNVWGNYIYFGGPGKNPKCP